MVSPIRSFINSNKREPSPFFLEEVEKVREKRFATESVEINDFRIFPAIQRNTSETVVVEEEDEG